jgi:hypothetical protein
LIRNINLPASVKASIESKINAEQDAQNDFCTSKEKQEAERKRVEAQGIADYQRIISIGLTHNCSMSLLKHKRTSSITKHKKIILWMVRIMLQ